MNFLKSWKISGPKEATVRSTVSTQFLITLLGLAIVGSIVQLKSPKKTDHQLESQIKRMYMMPTWMHPCFSSHSVSSCLPPFSLQKEDEVEEGIGK